LENVIATRSVSWIDVPARRQVLPENILDEQLSCSFCGTPQDKVHKLIAGPGVCICDECIFLCTEILEEACEQLFNDRVKAAKFIGYMQSIEKIDPNTFRETCAYIKGIFNGLRAAEMQQMKNARKKKPSARKTKGKTPKNDMD
jgi:hypothetical protein